MNTSAPNVVIGRYRLEKKLYEGQFGRVYRSWDSKLDRNVMVKIMSVIQKMKGDDWEEIRNRFFLEAKATGRLNHPNIVSVFDVGEHENALYIVMDQVNGITMDNFTQGEDLLPIKTVLRAGQQIAAALDHAHRKWVVHRDVKPQNIVFDSDTGTATLSDFGIARVLDQTRTKTGTVIGSPSYMSPEQVAGKKVDHRTDVFSLGVTLYELFTGKLPFVGNSIAKLMHCILNDAPRNPITRRLDLPQCAAAVLDTALQKDPAKRFQTGRAMGKAIKACIKNIKSNSG